MPAAFTPPNPDYAARTRDSFARQPAMALIGATITALEPGYCEVTLPYRDDLTQQHGFIHGGVTGMLADSASGYAGFTLMPHDASPLTVEYKINMLNPAHGDKLVARARVVKPGKTLVVTQCEVFAVKDNQEKHCATMQQTLIVMRGVPDEKRA